VPSLAAELLRVAQGASTYILKGANASGETGFGRNTGLNHLKIGDIEIPTDADGALFISFRRSNPAAYIPAWKVLSGELSPAEVAGRIILVGTSAPGLLDVRATPVSSAIPGVEIHAQVIEHILSEQLSAAELTHFVNELLTPLSETILEHRALTTRAKLQCRWRPSSTSSISSGRNRPQPPSGGLKR
jgi:CHASE2 domain-containing sensor protein